ncbi:hypothetical protein NDU88_003483 [Pleurodeles waltl]|uniref:Uncharacterized protein n=1 Tax=Pleurodeles waltl TaxID=8319 RepID=A0AAV7QA69_PLEWA|nr:hypothetical protein NDU88_003483 [Pleurodeles waltl]
MMGSASHKIQLLVDTELIGHATALMFESAVDVHRRTHVTSCALSEWVLLRRRPGRVSFNYSSDHVLCHRSSSTATGRPLL